MADSRTSVFTKILLGASLVTAATIGGVQLYVSGAGHFTGNLSGSGSLSIDGAAAIDGATTLGGALTADSLSVQPDGGTGAITIKDEPDGTGTGGIICIDNTSGTQVVCAVSGGLLDCDSFSGLAASCP